MVSRAANDSAIMSSNTTTSRANAKHASHQSYMRAQQSGEWNEHTYDRNGACCNSSDDDDDDSTFNRKENNTPILNQR